MTVPAKLDELHSRNTPESRADGAESRNGRRLPHNSGYIFFLKNNKIILHYSNFSGVQSRSFSYALKENAL